MANLCGGKSHSCVCSQGGAGACRLWVYEAQLGVHSDKKNVESMRRTHAHGVALDLVLVE